MVHLAQQEAAPVRGEPARIETGDNFAVAESMKFKLRARSFPARVSEVRS